MPKIIKVRCNGPNKCINEVDLKALIKDEDAYVYRMYPGDTSRKGPVIRSRYVLKCKRCSNGEVIITRQMIEENLSRD